MCNLPVYFHLMLMRSTCIDVVFPSSTYLVYLFMGVSKSVCVRNTVDAVLSGLCLKWISVFSGQFIWSRQNTP